MERPNGPELASLNGRHF
jgi:mRNA-degrading endonuclease RelE of RelBE toxin-antitoxin system